MLLSLSLLFRPNWQSSKASIRRKAVARLNPACDADSIALKQMALSDASTEVRLQALQKLNDPELLKRLSEQEPNQQVKTRACRLLCEWLTNDSCSGLCQQRLLTLISAVKQIDLLIHIALNAQDQQARRYAVHQLEDETALEQVVKFSNDPQQQLIAARAIDDPHRLQQLLQHSDTDKTNKIELIQLLQQRLIASNSRIELNAVTQPAL